MPDTRTEELRPSGVTGFYRIHGSLSVGARTCIVSVKRDRCEPDEGRHDQCGYYASKSFTDALAPETQRMRRNILERFRVTRAPSGQTYGDKWLATIERQHIIKLLGTLKPHAQKNWIKTIRGLMAFAVANNMRKDDPSAGVKAVKVRKSVGHMTWLEPQTAMYRERHKLGTVARLALELLLNISPGGGTTLM